MPLGNLLLVFDSNTETLSRFPASLSQDIQLISVGADLSTYLMIPNSVDRSRSTRQWLEDQLKGKAPGPVICADIDLLFHPSLQLDPLALFRQISRYTKLIILWPGDYKDGTLSYAHPGHNHYRSWRNLEGLDIKGVHDALQ
jgi:hypothetical protein